MRREPRVRKDGVCALKGCSKPLGRLAIEHGNPFHSAECCRAYHGVVYTMDEAGQGKSRTPSEKQRADFGSVEMIRTRRRERASV